MRGRERSVDRFESFVAAVQPRLMPALVARFGSVDGREATLEALSWAWEHWDRVPDLQNPVAYLYRVGVTASRRFVALSTAEQGAEPTSPAVEPDVDLQAALASLSGQQRLVVVLVYAYQWRQQEVADTLAIAPSTVNRHLTRALARLRSLVGDQV